MKKIISMLLVLCMVFAMGAPLQAYATQSSNNFSMAFTLTGDGAKDICAIALAQLGKTGLELGYSEMWCADFVSDCARFANQSDAVPFCGVVVAHDGTKNICEEIQNAGGKTVYDIPQKGDIAICNGWGHVEIIVDVNGETVTVVGGNGSGNGPYYSKVYKDTHHYKDSWFNQILRPNYRSKDLGKPALKGLRDKYPTGESVVLQCDPVSGANQYSFVAEKKSGSEWKVVHRQPRSASRECTIQVSEGQYRVYVLAYDTTRWMPDGSDYLYKVSDKVTFTVAGEHVCDNAEYVYYWKAHPHYNCYRCSICGKVNEDRSSSNYIESCRECNRPGKPAFVGLQESYSEGETVTIRWTQTEHTTHYDFWIWKQDDSGTWEDDHGKWKTYEHVFDVESGRPYNLPVGEYRVLVQACNKNWWEEDGSSYLLSESGFSYFSVKPAFAITSQPKNVTANVGDTAKFTVTASGSNLTYQWQYLSFDTGKWVDSGMAGARTATISVEATAIRNGRQYRCIVKGSEGTLTSNTATLTVKAAPVIQTQPKAVSTNPGKTVTFSVVARGASTWQWQYKAPGTSTWYNSGMTGAKTATLQVPATAARNGQQYRCVVTNAYGSVTSAAAKLTVLSKPAITTQPKSVTGAYGDVVKFTVAATGGSLSYQWQYKAPGTSTWYNSTMTGAKTATLSVTAEKARNGQQYRCVVTNSLGSVTSSAAKLTTASMAKPAITKQPKNLTVAAGDTAQLSVKATGGSLTYQWQFRAAGTSTWYNSTMTGAKTATLQVPATTARNGQQYRCIVTNSLGSVTSDAAKLTVQ